ncbi:MAG: hypothetical protein H5T95_07700 [Firmicutes bacterium]|nr:hypothetical protein [Bacillota bacterium]
MNEGLMLLGLGPTPGEAVSRLVDDYLNLRRVAEGGESPRPVVSRVRDLVLVDLLGDLVMVVACDSNASIGEKPMDSLKQPYAEMGRSAVKVPLMEVIASGATPILVVDALCVEMEPSGKKIIAAIRGELERAGLAQDIELTGSTEDNARTVQSGIGVTVIGLATRRSLRLRTTTAGDAIVCVGIPKSGVTTPYKEDDTDIAHVSTVMTLSRLPYIREILPVGSKGVRYEATELARYAGLELEEASPPPPIDMDTSAGASTAVLATLRPEHVPELRRTLVEPVFEIGAAAVPRTQHRKP